MAEAPTDTYRSPAEIERDPQGVVRRWTTELGLAKKRDKDWLDEAKKILDRYEGEKKAANSFNILWSNTRIMRPAVYNSVPKPDVRRRYRDADPLGKAASQVLERSLEYSLDSYDFHQRMKECVLDVLVPGRGVLRVYYDFEMASEEETDDAGEPVLGEDGKPVTYETITNETATCQFVQHDDFRHGPGKRWSQVPWVAFRHRMDRQALVRKFGDLGKKVELDEVDSDHGDKDIRGLFRTAEVWEIWDKVARKLKFICPSYKEAPLMDVDDPLRLKGFFPTPRPVYAIETTRSLKPVPIYRLYEEQAKELDKITARINIIVNALKVRGLRHGHLKELEALFEAGETDLVPIENVSEIMNIGLDKLVWIMPIEKLAQALRYLYEARNEIKNTIYEITGISDILRGSTAASETATAQRIKSNWGSLSLQDLQQEVQRYARDIIRLKAEIIAEHFQLETLQAITDLQFPSAEDKAMAQQQIQQAQMTQQEPPPEALEALNQPTWEDIQGLLKSDALRQYKIDIETDSTIAEEMAGDVEGITEVLTGLVNWFNGIGPIVQSGHMPAQSAKDIALAIVRRARMGSVVEDAIEEMGEGAAPAQQGPEAAPEAPQTDPQVTALEEQRVALEGQLGQMEHQREAQRLQLENGELQLENKRLQIEAAELRLKEMTTQADVANTNADTELKYAQAAKTSREAQAPMQPKIVQGA